MPQPAKPMGPEIDSGTAAEITVAIGTREEDGMDAAVARLADALATRLREASPAEWPRILRTVAGFILLQH